MKNKTNNKLITITTRLPILNQPIAKTINPAIMRVHLQRLKMKKTNHFLIIGMVALTTISIALATVSGIYVAKSQNTNNQLTDNELLSENLILKTENTNQKLSISNLTDSNRILEVTNKELTELNKHQLGLIEANLATIKGIQASLDVERSIVDSLRAQVASLQSELQIANTNIISNNVTIETLTNQNNVLTIQNQGLAKQVNDLKSQMAIDESNLSLILAAKAQYKARAIKWEADYHRVAGDYLASSQANDQLRVINQNSEAEIISLKDRIQTMIDMGCRG